MDAETKKTVTKLCGMIIGVTMFKIGLGLLFLILALDSIDGPYWL